MAPMPHQDATTSATRRPEPDEIRAAIRDSSLSYAAVGRRLGVHRQTVIRWATGRARPSQTTLEALKKIMEF